MLGCLNMKKEYGVKIDFNEIKHDIFSWNTRRVFDKNFARFCRRLMWHQQQKDTILQKTCKFSDGRRENLEIRVT